MSVFSSSFLLVYDLTIHHAFVTCRVVKLIGIVKDIPIEKNVNTQIFIPIDKYHSSKLRKALNLYGFYGLGTLR